MKLTRILIVALGLMVLASGSVFAAATFNATGGANQIAVNAVTGRVGDVALVGQATGTIPAGSFISIAYNAPITSLTQVQITVAGTPLAIPTLFNTPQTTGNFTVTIATNNITIAFAADQAVAPAAEFLRVSGVRVNAVGFAQITADLSSGGPIGPTVSYFPSTVTVGNTLEPLQLLSGATAAPTTVAATTNLNTAGEGTASTTVTVKENFPNAFETVDGSSRTETQVKLTVTVPAALKLPAAGAVSVTSNNTSLVLDATTPFTLAGNVLTVFINSQNPSLTESFSVTFNFVAATSPLTLAPGNASVTATLAPPPVGTPPFKIGPDDAATTALEGGPLFYQDHQTAAITITFGVKSLETNLLSVFNTTEGFETGIVVTNASDIFDPGLGQPGVIKVTLYPADGSAPKTFTTSGTAANRPGRGLSTVDGSLPIGGSWIVTLSQLLAPAGITGDFTGMVVFDCKFSGGEGVNYITDESFSTQAQGYPMIVFTLPIID